MLARCDIPDIITFDHIICSTIPCKICPQCMNCEIIFANNWQLFHYYNCYNGEYRLTVYSEGEAFDIEQEDNLL